ncbi:hypothetical protein BVK86_11975 [Pseudomonas reinekei]|uniref:Uncharacterized protein n=1 Tax=Pseudomonas reinekei TaxID=395598 RepID=A0A1Q9WW88_PSERE|nr:hypothetical protein BVK86_11975 [Pseudomonas reinekei]
MKVNPKPLWERACSRRRIIIQPLCWLTHRFREQARSHICFRVPVRAALVPAPVWTCRSPVRAVCPRRPGRLQAAAA